MKRRMTVVLAILGVAVVGLAAVVAADSGTRPLKGSFEGDVTFNQVDMEVCPASELLYGGMSSDAEATGTMTHLGRTTLVSSHCTPAGEAVTGGKATLIAANGDKLYASYSGTAPFPIPGVTEHVEADIDFEITGGTGRFDDATGSGKMYVSIEFLGFEELTWPAVWEWEGTIGY